MLWMGLACVPRTSSCTKGTRLGNVTVQVFVCRAEAVRCTGLLCMLADGCDAAAAADCAQRIALLRTAFLADPGAAVREAAAKALCDLAVLRWVPVASPSPRVTQPVHRV